MGGLNLVDSFAEFKEFKNIDRPTMTKVLEDVFRTLLRKKYGEDENFDIIINTEQGDLEMWRHRVVVEDANIEDELAQVGLTEAHGVDPDLEVGDEAFEEITIEDFGRRAILAARQTLVSRIMELEKDEIYRKYGDRIGDIVSAEVYQVWKKEILLLDDEGNELILPASEQIRSDYFKKGDTIRAVVKKVEMRNNTPFIILSRTDNAFLAKLLELEVPEIFDGLITIKNIVREPGERAKVAVESYDDRIDPVGACVGMKGSRIHGIVRELRNENIDIINFTNNMSLFITRSLSPAKITSLDIDNETKRVSVYLKPDQISLAIGKGGLNIKLAGKLTGFEIDVFRESVQDEEYDIDLEEFSDEIEGWIIDELKGIGCDTARSVLELDKDELVRRADLEEETIEDVLKVLREEFDDEDITQMKAGKASEKAAAAKEAEKEAVEKAKEAAKEAAEKGETEAVVEEVEEDEEEAPEEPVAEVEEVETPKKGEEPVKDEEVSEEVKESSAEEEATEEPVAEVEAEKTKDEKSKAETKK